VFLLFILSLFLIIFPGWLLYFTIYFSCEPSFIVHALLLDAHGEISRLPHCQLAFMRPNTG
jgi:hypothetical protein